MRGFRELDPISQKDPLLGKVCTSNFTYSLLPLHNFANLIIGEVADPLSSKCPFLQVHIALLMLRETND